MPTTMRPKVQRPRGSLKMALAFKLFTAIILLGSPMLSAAIQAADPQQQQQPQQVQPQSQAAGQSGSHLDGAPMISMGSESSSALEASSALAADDLMAAESSQTPGEPEHKAFTRQEQMASVAPVIYAQSPPQQPQVPGQQQVSQQQVVAQNQQQQPPVFSIHPGHLMQAQRLGHMGGQQPPKGFNSFMAAALAGNYGPAQQQIAAAAAASLQAQQSRQQQQQQPLAARQIPLMSHHPAPAPQQPAQHHMQPPQHHHQQAPPQVHHQAHPMMSQQPPVQVQPQAQQQQQQARAESPPPQSYNSMVDSNSIELSEQQPAQSTQLAAASSAQHPVIAAASSSQLESGAGSWPLQAPDIPKIVNLEVKCEKNLMKVSVEFDKIFNGVIFSKGHFSQGQCVHVGQNSGKQQAYFDISINSCGTQGNTQNGLYGMGGNTGSGTYFENTIVIQYDPNVQEVYDHARKLRCTWHDQYEKAVTFRPFPVDMLDIVRADFAGDNVGCWMQIQVGKGPWASEVAGIVKIGQTMTMVLAIKDEENKFDMLVRNCFAHDGKRGPIELVDKSGCITRPKLMSRFTKIKNFGSSATVLSYAHFQAFKFPDSMEVHFQCTIQICRHQCPEQCSPTSGPAMLSNGAGESYSESTISGTFNIGQQGGASNGQSDSVHLRKYGAGLSRERRDLSGQLGANFTGKPLSQTVGLNRVIQVVSTGDLAFNLNSQQVNGTSAESLGDGPLPVSGEAAAQMRLLDLSQQQVCMSSYHFVLALVLLVLVLLCSSLLAISLFLRQRQLTSGAKSRSKQQLIGQQSQHSSCSTSPASTMRPSGSHQVPRSQQQQQQQQQQLYPSNRDLHQQLMFEAQARGH